MKTTIEIPDPLLDEIKVLAREEHTTVRALIEDGLRRLLETRASARRFRLRRASFRGKGLHPEVRGGSWEVVRELIYAGRGG